MAATLKGRAMRNGRIVQVQLHGDNRWYPGKVIKAKKMWVDLYASHYPGGSFIADENSIKKWRYK